MENKYFTPEISDIRVGYECEANPKFYSEQEGIWRPIIIKGVGQEVIYYHSLGVYRTPYLTKEQIEAEGWIVKVVDTDFIHFSKSKELNIDNSGYIVSLFFSLKDHKIRINNVFSMETTTKVLYEGECKDINTFRYICKLLKIN